MAIAQPRAISSASILNCQMCHTQVGACWNDLHACLKINLCLCATVPGDGALGWCIPKWASTLRLQAYIIQTSPCCHKVCMLLNSYSSFAGCIACLRNKSAHWSAEAWLRSFVHDLQMYLNLFLFHGVYACDGSPMACNCEIWPMQGGLLRNSNLLSGNLCAICNYTSARSQLSESTIGMVAMQGAK